MLHIVVAFSTSICGAGCLVWSWDIVADNGTLNVTISRRRTQTVIDHLNAKDVDIALWSKWKRPEGVLPPRTDIS